MLAVLGTPLPAVAESSRIITTQVVDERGQPRAGATVVACPENDCSLAVASSTNAGGIAQLRLAGDHVWSVFAFVANPVPAWPCPGFELGDDVLYISEPADAVTGSTLDLPRWTQFTIVTQTAYDCAPLRVTDQYGQPISGAAFFVDDGFSAATLEDGVVRMAVEPGRSYQLQPFVANWDAPCPGYVAGDGTAFHFGDRQVLSAEDLIDGADFVIVRPDPSDCQPTPLGAVRLVDAQGTPLPSAVAGFCEYDPASPPNWPNGNDGCIASGFVAADTLGIAHVPVVDSGHDIGIAGFLACEGGGFEFSDSNTVLDGGYSRWSVTGEQLLAGGLTVTFPGDVATCLGW